MANVVEEASLYVMPDGPEKTKLEYKTGHARDVAIQIRGNPANPGAVVSRRFLSVLSAVNPPPTFRNGSGRLELANAILNEGAPLSARVAVNRIWQHHFGRGLVATPSNFGSQGERPTHPELLDDLTVRFTQNGWSVKRLHRDMMLSAAYRQSSTDDLRLLTEEPDHPSTNPPEASGPRAIDPGNRWLWRMNRRRLEIEAWRDAMLVVSGNLDARMGGPSSELSDVNHRRRTIYGTVHRRELDQMLGMHDFPDPNSHSPVRQSTTTPLQQLFVLNSPFMTQQSGALATRLTASNEAETRVHDAYQLLYARDPTNVEVRLAMEFLTSGNPEKRTPEQRWQQYFQVLLGGNEFLFID
jgi:hypothetical protein